ncbi:MAG TPA: PPC domain-containing DNA-binding protein [Thermoplasmata archaeon]|nr:PPC domain-containing DNA-binding protein [Thermoplasmata archaeon]
MQAVSSGEHWAVRLSEGETLPTALEAFARAQHIRAAMIVSGIGLLRETTVGYWNGQEYETSVYPAPLELVSAAGSIAEVDGQPSVHLHVALGGKDHALVGGHLVRATIGLLAEVALDTFPGRVFGRPLDESRGIRMLDLEPGSNPV